MRFVNFLFIAIANGRKNPKKNKLYTYMYDENNVSILYSRLQIFMLFHIWMCQYSRVFPLPLSFTFFTMHKFILTILFDRFDIIYEAIHRFIYYLNTNYNAQWMRCKCCVCDWNCDSIKIKLLHTRWPLLSPIAAVDMRLLFSFDWNLIFYVLPYLTDFVDCCVYANQTRFHFENSIEYC